jgi:hypothetical protein
VQREFISIGYDFFNDRETFSEARFINANLFDVESEQMRKIMRIFGIVDLGMVLHLWDYNGQMHVCERVVDILRDEVGVLVVGQCVADVEGREVASGKERKIFKHNVETSERMREEVGKRTGTGWRVEAWLGEGLGIDGERSGAWDGEVMRRLGFCVERVM